MRKHTMLFLERWLSNNNLTWFDLKSAYHRATGRNVSVDDVLRDSTDTWRYYWKCY